MSVVVSASDEAHIRPPIGLVTLPFFGLIMFTCVNVSTRTSLGEAGIIVALVGLLLRARGLRYPAPCWWAIAFIAWAFLTSFSAFSPEYARETTVDRLKVVVIFFVALNTLWTERQLRAYLLIFLAIFMIFPARGTILNYLHGYTTFGRAIWNQGYSNPNYLGAFALLAFGVALSFVTAKAEISWVRWGAAASAIILLGVMLLTQSRGVFLGLVLGVGPALLGRAIRRPAVAIYLVLLLGIVTVFVPDAAWQRFSGISKLRSVSTIAEADPEGSAAERWEIQKTAWRIFRDHPLSGIGLGCYPQANNLYAPRLGFRDTHNTYLNIAAELGLPGLILWIGLVLSVMRHVWRSRRLMPNTVFDVQLIWTERAVIGFLIGAVVCTVSSLAMLYLMLATLWCGAELALKESGDDPDHPARAVAAGGR